MSGKYLWLGQYTCHDTVLQKETPNILIHVDKEAISAFQELVQRGANLWPDAPVAIKQFADLVTSGHIMQNYEQQDPAYSASQFPQSKVLPASTKGQDNEPASLPAVASSNEWNQ